MSATGDTPAGPGRDPDRGPLARLAAWLRESGEISRLQRHSTLSREQAKQMVRERRRDDGA